MLYEAVSERLKRTVLLKVFTPDPAKSRDEQWTEAEHWLRVMNIVGELANPPRVHAHLVRVTDVHTFADTAEGPRHYAVMEYLHGDSLEARLKERGAFDLSRVANYAMQLASALDSLHEAGVAHGHINGENALFDRPNGEVLKLVGFGMESKALEVHPEAAGQDRRALVALVKHLIAASHLGNNLSHEAKKVLLLGADTQNGFATSIEFARAFRDAAYVPHGTAPVVTRKAPEPAASVTPAPAPAPAPVEKKLDAAFAPVENIERRKNEKPFWRMPMLL